jgi:hypothetical protein
MLDLGEPGVWATRPATAPCDIILSCGACRSASWRVPGWGRLTARGRRGGPLRTEVHVERILSSESHPRPGIVCARDIHRLIVHRDIDAPGVDRRRHHDGMTVDRQLRDVVCLVPLVIEVESSYAGQRFVDSSNASRLVVNRCAWPKTATSPSGRGDIAIIPASSSNTAPQDHSGANRYPEQFTVHRHDCHVSGVIALSWSRGRGVETATGRSRCRSGCWRG